MCFADIDAKTLMRETEDRLAGVSAPSIAPAWGILAWARNWLAARLPNAESVAPQKDALRVPVTR